MKVLVMYQIEIAPGPDELARMAIAVQAGTNAIRGHADRLRLVKCYRSDTPSLADTERDLEEMETKTHAST